VTYVAVPDRNQTLLYIGKKKIKLTVVIKALGLPPLHVQVPAHLLLVQVVTSTKVL